MQYFRREDLIAIKKQRNVLLTIFIAVLSFYVLATAGFITWVALLPYGSTMIFTVKVIHYVVTGAFIIFAFIFIGIPFRRANKAYKFCIKLEKDIKETSEASFFEYDDALQEKDGVDCKSLIFLEWNKYKEDYFERKVLVFFDKPFPEIKENSKVKFITQGNFLIEYEILEEGDDTSGEPFGEFEDDSGWDDDDETPNQTTEERADENSPNEIQEKQTDEKE